MKTEPIRWTGDLDDDCFAEWGGMFAHAECMGDVRVRDISFDDTPEIALDPECESEYWWAGVFDGSKVGRTELWSTNDVVGYVIGGARARELCEWVMRALAVERDRDELLRLARLVVAMYYLAVRDGDLSVAVADLEQAVLGRGWIDTPEPVALQLTRRAEAAEKRVAELEAVHAAARRCHHCGGSGRDPHAKHRYTSGGHDDRSCPKCNGEGVS